MSVALTPVGPDLRPVVSLAAWTWQGAGPDGREFANALITHTPAPTVDGVYQLLQTEVRGASDHLCRSEGLATLGFPTIGRSDASLAPSC